MNYDLNLLRAFYFLYQERSVSRAAEKLHISQSAMSAQLARLRTLFSDPLFAREKYGITPTDKSHRIISEVSKALEAFDALVLQEQVFDPRGATNTFVIAANDYFETLLLPHVFKALKHQAPHTSLRVIEFNQRVQDSPMMTSDIHLAFGRVTSPPDNVICQTVLTESFACVLDPAQQNVGDTLTRTEFESHDHIVVKPTAKLATGVFSVLNEVGLQRKVSCEVPHFHALPTLILGSSCIATVPTGIADYLVARHPLRAVKPPESFSSFPFHLVWHQRYQNDPAHQWFRQLVRTCCQNHSRHLA